MIAARLQTRSFVRGSAGKCSFPSSRARMAVVRPSVATATVQAPTEIAQDVKPEPIDVDLLNKKLEAKAKALISLEEQEASMRPKVKVSIQRQVALGEAWKLVGRCPELGSFIPEVAPYMKWSDGHVWTYEGKMRHGTIEYKLVLRKADGAYAWEEGPDRKLTVEGGPEDTIEVKIDNLKLPA